MNRVNRIMSDENLIQILENFRPTPSSSFYTRMQKAPWTNRYRITRYALQAAILMAVIFVVILINPSSMPPLTSTNTPTSTPTIRSTMPSVNIPITSDVSPTENTSILTPSGTPSS
jgi:hypothetical protein